MAIRSRLRSTMSASAPAGMASSISGKLSAASTSATSDGDDESSVISQPAPTSCIQLPMLDTSVAIHRLRNTAFCSGHHGERSARPEAAGGGEAGDGAVLKTFSGGWLEPPCTHGGFRRFHSSELQHELVDVAPAPILSRFERSHDRMLGRPEMLRGVFVLRIVAASDVAARSA